MKMKEYKNQEKRDFEFPKIIDYGEIKYTPENLSDINKEQGDQFDQNITDIAGNQASITANATQIALNVTNISGNSASITVNYNKIALNVTNISGNSSNITINDNRISTEVTDRTNADNTLQSNITQTANQIQLKVGDSAGTKASITVGNINGGTVVIQGKNITLNGNTTVEGTFHVSGDVVSGGTITGSQFQTATSGKRVVIDSTYNAIAFYDSSGASCGSLYGSGGALFMSGGGHALFAPASPFSASTLTVYGLSGVGISPHYDNSLSLGASSSGWTGLFLTGTGNPVIARGSTAYIYLTSSEILANQNILPNANDYFELGSSLYGWRSLYLTGFLYLGSGSYVSGNIVPTSNNNFNIGSSSYYYANVYALNYPASPLKVSKSGIDSFRKVGKAIKRKGEYHLETSALPEEFQITDEKGKKHTELKRTIGLTVQAVSEIVKRLDSLDEKINQLTKN